MFVNKACFLLIYDFQLNNAVPSIPFASPESFSHAHYSWFDTHKISLIVTCFNKLSETLSANQYCVCVVDKSIKF